MKWYDENVCKLEYCKFIGYCKKLSILSSKKKNFVINLNTSITRMTERYLKSKQNEYWITMMYHGFKEIINMTYDTKNV